MSSSIVLNSILGANEYKELSLDRLMGTGISKEWFEDEREKIVFGVIDICYKAGRAFDDTVILQHLQKANMQNADEILLDIVTQKQVPQSIALAHIEGLKEKYHQRVLEKLSNEIKSMTNNKDNPEAITQMVQNTLNDFDFLSSRGHTKSLRKVRENRKQKPPAQRIKTHIPFIDTVLTDKHNNSGIRNEGLFFISGLKQSGKTFILTRIIENVSKDHPVMFGSLEFGEDLYDETIEEMEEDGYFSGNIDNIFTFDSIYDVDTVIAEIRFQHKLNGIKLVALDSMMRLTNNNPDLKTDEKRISEMFSKFGKLSKELKLPIIIIVQSSKEDLKSSNISVKGSMNADHEAYVWFHVVKTNKDPLDEQRTVIWNKNKDTRKHPKQHLMFMPSTSDFYRIKVNDKGEPDGAMDNYRKPKIPIEVVYYDETIDNPPSMDDIPKTLNLPTL